MKDKFFTAAKAVSMNGNGVGTGRTTYRLGSVLVNKNSILVIQIENLRMYRFRFSHMDSHNHQGLRFFFSKI